jgi:putative phosphoesterase
MRLGLISDIHGDQDALESACTHLAKLGADQIVCAGDLVGYGPDPDQVVAFLQARGIPSVRGNHDRWAGSRALGAPDEFGGGIPGRESIMALRSLSSHLVLEAGSRVVVVAHGSPRSDMEFMNRQTHPPEVLRKYLRDLTCDILVVGHTHQPMWYRAPDGRLVVNPGSIISLPVIDSSSSFAIVDLEDLAVSFHQVQTGDPIPLDPWQ